MAEILVVDDDVQFGATLVQQLQQAGHGVSLAVSLAEATARAGKQAYDIVLLDVNLPDGSGLTVLPQLRNGIWPPEVIIITGYGDTHSAELAIESGAWDFIHKGASAQAITLSLSRALQYRESRTAIPQRVVFHTPDIIGHSDPLRACLEVAAQAAGGDVNTLICGETGTGKELFARAIHDNSPRHDGPFVPVDCTALPENLIPATLFGHHKGAFTGAQTNRRGLVAEADGGSLFLDEIGDLPPEVQKSFLRVLQERRFRPVGATDEVHSNFRLIAATNRDLDAMADTGEFRSDLLYRLRAVTMTLPPLRRRRDDIPLLTKHYLARECAARGNNVKGLAEDFTEAMQAYDWPGNVRELAHAVAGAVARAGTDPVLFAKHLPTYVRIPLAQANCPAPRTHAGSDTDPRPPGLDFRIDGPLPTLREVRGQFERAYLQELVRQANGDVHKACELAGYSRPQVYAMLKKHDIRL